ncbi:hypothetical protein FJTKL_01244 [Diaporthe vaccinii]|uniref:Uncharacterized protein n=1 Tax=Diaporthe vaccinii TaxID=105482 RepID=A0ABR4F5K2_9PEZI
MMMMKMMTMIPFLLVLFALLGLADTPGRETTLPEELARRFDHLLERLDTIAANVHPPLPTPLLATAVFFVFCTSIPSRLAAAWGRLVERAAAAAPQSRWAWLAKAVSWVDWVLSPFKLKDWEARTKKSEAALEETNNTLQGTNDELENATAELAKTTAELTETKRKLEASQTELGAAKIAHEGTITALDNRNSDLEEAIAEKRRIEDKYLETVIAHGRTLQLWAQFRTGASQNP